MRGEGAWRRCRGSQPGGCGHRESSVEADGLEIQGREGEVEDEKVKVGLAPTGTNFLVCVSFISWKV